MQSMPNDSRKWVLFTGAGFTYNFGGFLGQHLWSKIFNLPWIQNKERIKELLLGNFDFEAVYSNVWADQSFSLDEKYALKHAVETTYDWLDENISHWVANNKDHPTIEMNFFEDLLGPFWGSDKQKGYIFTINQDLFMERYFDFKSPGAPNFDEKYQAHELLPDEIEIEETKKDLDVCSRNPFYIKLHGSFGWRSKFGGASSRMVIGLNKIRDIAREPLLKWYFGVFQKVINEGNKNILIIGYGFKDKHINDIFLEGVEKHNLRLFIINPEQPLTFKKTLIENQILPLWSGLKGYFPYTMSQMFPPGQKKSVFFDEIRINFIDV